MFKKKPKTTSTRRQHKTLSSESNLSPGSGTWFTNSDSFPW